MIQTAKQQKALLRQHYRDQRNRLSQQQRSEATAELSQRVLAHPWLQQAQRIACYLPHEGEVNTQPIIETLWHNKQSVYLPILDPVKAHHMRFAHYQANTTLISNRYDILEPAEKNWIENLQLHAVLMPLVAFDEHGHRLGMGAGYYDHSFAFKTNTNQAPRLIGLAYECQKDVNLPSDPWDIPLDLIITEKQAYTI